ncbi:MAG TPA: PhzF family phenazine biosynthesis protein [Tepidisphaeraceae bacterium]|jgi:PhzF family phenazine biosynthesis protein
MNTTTPIHQVDAFTGKAFTGNPAAVCLLAADQRPGAPWMQLVAAEMNLAETAFVQPEPAGDAFALRWFTPQVEVDLCGHATLASAHVLWEAGKLKTNQPARFHTKSGLLTCTRGGDGWIEMDFPALAPKEVSAPPEGLLGSLGARDAVAVARSRFDYFVQLKSEAQVRGLAPDFYHLKKVETRGTIVTAKSDSGEFDFVSRFFAPQTGIDEDPATGSAHCSLAPWWAERLGKKEMIAYQCSARGAVVRVKLRGDRVLLGGQATTVLRGELVC